MEVVLRLHGGCLKVAQEIVLRLHGGCTEGVGYTTFSKFCVFCVVSAISLPNFDENFSDFHEYVQECPNSVKFPEKQQNFEKFPQNFRNCSDYSMFYSNYSFTSFTWGWYDKKNARQLKDVEYFKQTINFFGGRSQNDDRPPWF